MAKLQAKALAHVDASVRAYVDAVSKWEAAFAALMDGENLRTIERGNKLASWATNNGAGTEEEPVFGTPQPLPGLISTSFEPEESEVKVYADDIVHYSRFVQSSITGEITLLQAPSAFNEHVLDDEKQTNGLILNTGTRSAFAFQFISTVESDTGFSTPKLSIYYNCKISAPATETTTVEDSIEPNNLVYSVTSSAHSKVLGANGTAASKGYMIRNEENADIFDMFMDEIITPATLSDTSSVETAATATATADVITDTTATINYDVTLNDDTSVVISVNGVEETVTTTGAGSFEVTGLTAETPYDITMTSELNSDAVTIGQFTTIAAGV